MSVGRVLFGVIASLVGAWTVLVILLVLAKPKGSLVQETLRVLPDTLRMLRGLATDHSLPRGVRIGLWLLLVYVAMPFDLIPDFIPIIGYADDVILIVLVLRAVIRWAGPEAVSRHWPGTDDGLAALRRVVGSRPA